MKKNCKKRFLKTYIPPSFVVDELLLEYSVMNQSVVVEPIKPGVDVEYEWEDGDEIGGDYEW